jgi:murein DD-endopeptidase MepM/ murein hydrolase activator NlpD
MIKSYNLNAAYIFVQFEKDALFRLWPKDSPYIKPGTFIYPVKQKWFASMTQSGNEPTYVDWGENLRNKSIYYHSAHDIGGAEGKDEIVSATDGLIISAYNEILNGYDTIPVFVHPDDVSILDNRGWLLEYSHLDSIDSEIKLGKRIKIGQRIGFIGKKGGSGGWVHLHFEIKNNETPSGRWSTEDAYVYVWESYIKMYKPSLIAVARPHKLAWTNQQITIDGRKSKSLAGDIVSYEWIFTDGSAAMGAVQNRSYKKPGEYNEILKVTDFKGNVDYDFTVVQVYDRNHPELLIPAIQAAYYPTLNLKPGIPITFLVRTFNTGVGNEVWDFGDGSPQVTVKSETVNRKESSKGKFAETIHSFSKPGHYIIRVERSNESGFMAITHLHVVVE